MSRPTTSFALRSYALWIIVASESPMAVRRALVSVAAEFGSQAKALNVASA
jgi:hypothetical protein